MAILAYGQITSYQFTKDYERVYYCAAGESLSSSYSGSGTKVTIDNHGIAINASNSQPNYARFQYGYIDDVNSGSTITVSGRSTVMYGTQVGLAVWTLE